MEQKTAQDGTTWEFVPAGCQYRNGLAERRVAVVKQTLKHVLGSTIIANKPVLGYAELQVVLTQVANITNDRPIGIHHLTEDELVLLTVNQLLLGRNSTQKPCYNEEGELTTLCRAREFHHHVFELEKKNCSIQVDLFLGSTAQNIINTYT